MLLTEIIQPSLHVNRASNPVPEGRMKNKNGVYGVVRIEEDTPSDGEANASPGRHSDDAGPGDFGLGGTIR